MSAAHNPAGAAARKSGSLIFIRKKAAIRAMPHPLCVGELPIFCDPTAGVSGLGFAGRLPSLEPRPAHASEALVRRMSAPARWPDASGGRQGAMLWQRRSRKRAVAAFQRGAR